MLVVIIFASMPGKGSEVLLISIGILPIQKCPAKDWNSIFSIP